MKNPSTRKLALGCQIAITIILVSAMISLMIPDVRASVQGWLGLSTAPSNQMPASPVTLVANTEAPTPSAPSPINAYPMQTALITQAQAGSSSGIPIDISQQATQSGLAILTPRSLPEGYHYQSAFFDTQNKMLSLTYLVTRPLPGSSDPSLTSSETITLLESLKNDFVPMQIAPSTHITDIQINGTPAAYTVGGWDTEFVKDSTAPNGGKMVSSWRNDLPVKNLYWQVGRVYLLLVTADESVSQQDLTDMAASIR